ncbi:hypothetical protein [Halegenticoccus tardaugens]|uniref:hypothetical protein n=1 Tax=Halegenticoccus tardaugens TaxID=2071624 RepID=UPI001E4026D2|nr:hypothetical protein [Halegenticoccus tardaugens]
MPNLLTGWTSVITDGMSGIGRGIVLKLVPHGADVVVDVCESPRTPETTPTLETIEERTNSQGLFAGWDVTNYDDLVGQSTQRRSSAVST